MSQDYPSFYDKVLLYRFIYSLVGLVLGLACIIAGVILGLAGVVGKTSWTASALGLSSNLTDATPGVIVFIVGVFMVFLTRFKVKHQSPTGHAFITGDARIEGARAKTKGQPK